MSCICYCDEDSCTNKDADCTIYDISYDAHKTLRDKIGRLHQHICADCVEYYNDDYTEEEPLIIKDDIFDIILNQKAKELD